MHFLRCSKDLVNVMKKITVLIISDQNDKTVIWLTLLGKTARLEFRKSCASITISSSNVKMLHSIKLCLANMFCTQNSSVNDTAPDALLIKAKVSDYWNELKDTKYTAV